MVEIKSVARLVLLVVGALVVFMVTTWHLQTASAQCSALTEAEMSIYLSSHHGNLTTGWFGQIGQPEVAAFSAVFDDRYIITTSPAVVVFGYFSPDVEWTLWFSNVKCTVHSSKTYRYYHGSHTALTFNSSKYSGPPLAVSASLNGSYVFKIPVIRPDKSSVQDLNVCLGTIFTKNRHDRRYQSPLSLVSWVELQLVLGVSHITMYNVSIPPAWGPAVQHYQRAGLLQVHQVGQLHLGEGEYQHQSLVINDCLYRNMHRYKHTLVVDLDEVILPRSAPNLTQLVADLEEQHGYQADHFQFENSFFFLDSPYVDNTSDIDFFRFRRRFDYSADPFKTKDNYVRPKSIIKPGFCLQSWPHGCQQAAAAVSRVRQIAREVAAVNHYRRCENPRWGRTRDACRTFLQQGNVLDDRMLAFRDQVQDRVGKVMAQL